MEFDNFNLSTTIFGSILGLLLLLINIKVKIKLLSSLGFVFLVTPISTYVITFIYSSIFPVELVYIYLYIAIMVALGIAIYYSAKKFILKSDKIEEIIVPELQES